MKKYMMNRMALETIQGAVLIQTLPRKRNRGANNKTPV